MVMRRMHRCFPRDSGGYFNRLKVRQNVSAVTAACLVVRRSVYLQVGVWTRRSASLTTMSIFGLKLIDAGFRSIYTICTIIPFRIQDTWLRGYRGEAGAFPTRKNYLAGKWGTVSVSTLLQSGTLHMRGKILR